MYRGSVEFSDVVNYVRSGDFVRELLAQRQHGNEYAFYPDLSLPLEIKKDPVRWHSVLLLLDQLELANSNPILAVSPVLPHHTKSE